MPGILGCPLSTLMWVELTNYLTFWWAGATVLERQQCSLFFHA